MIKFLKWLFGKSARTNIGVKLTKTQEKRKRRFEKYMKATQNNKHW